MTSSSADYICKDLFPNKAAFTGSALVLERLFNSVQIENPKSVFWKIKKGCLSLIKLFITCYFSSFSNLTKTIVKE